MKNYLTVPPAPPDSPTLSRARLASGKHIKPSATTLSIRQLSDDSHVERGSFQRRMQPGLGSRRRYSPTDGSTVACKPVCGFILGRETDFKPDQQQKGNTVCAGM